MAHFESQICIECQEPTGRPPEDHLFCKDCGTGPYCDDCYASHRGEHYAEAQSA